MTDRVLVTGHRGLIGSVVTRALIDAGLETVGIDLADGDDVTDARTVRGRMRGCSAVVHLAALDEASEGPFAPPSTGTTEEILRTNVAGTGLLLAEAAAAGMKRVVLLSSVDVLGCFMGQGVPSYLPIDDAHPVDPHGAYAWSKLAAEELCAAFTAATGRASICLRAPGVFDEATYDRIRVARRERPEIEWDPVWEYGAFLDVRDLAAAVVLAVTAPALSGHHRVLLCADDISSATEESLVLARRLLPDIPVRDALRYRSDPFAALVDSRGAQALLGWRPVHRWRPEP